MDSSIRNFTRQQQEVVGREQDEVENLSFLLENLRTDELENLGYALVGLRVASSEPWVGGKSLLTLEAPVAGEALPRSTLRTGELVQLVPPHGGLVEGVAKGPGKGPGKVAASFEGVVSKITNSSVVVVMDKKTVVPKKWGDKCSIKVRTSDVPHSRMLEALEELARFSGRRPNLHRVMFGGAQPAFGPQPAVADDAFLDASLNDEQRAAVRLAVAAKDIALIHGPPGTGKTHTLIEVIRQLLAQGKKLLVCGASNVAVDNIAERLGRVDNIGIVRMGHPAKISKPVLQLTTGALVEKADKGTPLGLKRQELAARLRAASKCRDPETRTAIREQIRVLRKEISKHTDKASRALVTNARVVLSTLCGAGNRDLTRRFFDVVIIDEATQALEAECWIAAIKAPKVILAGDHHQLPPTLINSTNQQNRRVQEATPMPAPGAGNGELMYTTMFERVRSLFGSRVCHMLTVQYRMHADIAKVSSERLYDGRLVAHQSVATHVLADLAHVTWSEHTAAPLVFVDTTGAGCHESFEKIKWMSLARLGRPVRVSKSMVNKREAQLVVAHVKRLLAAGLPPQDIAVITPYNGQVRLLKLLCKDLKGIEIGSVDGFQGSEKEAVVLSLVRSNTKQEIGFLSDYRRINVAITRARRHLCVVGDGDTVCAKSHFLHALVSHLDAVGVTQSVN